MPKKNKHTSRVTTRFVQFTKMSASIIFIIILIAGANAIVVYSVYKKNIYHNKIYKRHVNPILSFRHQNRA